jgi:drug/metabolite transporter (DMT)-like permease
MKSIEEVRQKTATLSGVSRTPDSATALSSANTLPTSEIKPKNAALGVAMVLGAAALFAANGTAAKLILRSGLDPQRLTLLRGAGACAGLMVVALLLSWRTRDLRRLRVSTRELPLLAVYGLIGFFLVPALYFYAINRIPIGIALLFEFTAPLFVALWARFGQRERVRGRLWVGLTLSLVGLACVAEVWGDLRLDSLGVAASLLAAVLLGAYYVLGARSVEQRDPISLTGYAFGVAAIAGMAYQMITSGPGLTAAGWRPLTGTVQGAPVWLLAVYLVIGGSIIPYALVVAALRHLPATSVSIIGMVEPVIAGTIAWFTLSEVLNLAQLAGSALLLAGVGLAETARVAERPSAVVVGESLNA